MSKIKIILNGEDFFWSKEKSILDLIQELSLDIKKIAIEKNYEIILPENFAKTFMEENDKAEIVHFIGGG